MANFFEFEADFVDSLHCIPMQVRQKLDTSGIKLKLSDWSHLTKAEREALVELPCSTEAEIQVYREYLQNLVLQHTGTLAAELPIEPYPEWLDAKTVPTNLQEKAREFGVMLSSQQWAELTDLQRFALIKLSRPSHENQNFPKALKEFNLL
ncbi:MAG: nitrate reductase associated protein [Brasilonema sp.]